MKRIRAFVIALTFQVIVSCSPEQNIFEKYKNLTVIDVHNHDAAKYGSSLAVWDKYGIDKIVLFGAISEPAAVETDKLSLEAYKKHPDRFYPFFAGFDPHDRNWISIIKGYLEAGYFGIGEFVGASTQAPMTAKLAWKADHPLDGIMPDVYRVCALFGAPIMLHIDPPFGYPIQRFEEALLEYPDTLFIFAHANAYNTPGNIEVLLAKHNNLYIDFFAGFTAYNKDSAFKLTDFVPVIKRYPDRFLVSSDSGYGVGYDKAYKAIYELFDLLEPAVAEKLAHENFERIVSGRK